MATKKTNKTSPKRDPNKRLLGAWVKRDLYEATKRLAAERGHGNASVVVIEAITEYLERARSEKK